MNNVYLHDSLADMFGPVWRFEVKSAAEAVRALGANCRGFLPYLKRNSSPGYHVVVGNPGEGSVDRSVEELGVGVGDQDIHIFPTVSGAKQSGWTNVILGAVIVAIGAVSLVYGNAYGWNIVAHGASMMLGGVAMLLSRPPGLEAPKEDDYDKIPSYIFNGPINTQAQGHPVPVGYGMLRVGGGVISTSLIIEDFVPGVVDPNGIGFRITNLPVYSVDVEEPPAQWSQELHAAGGTAPYIFRIVSQSPESHFSVTTDAGKSYLATTTAPIGPYKITVECEDNLSETVQKELSVNLQPVSINPGDMPY